VEEILKEPHCEAVDGTSNDESCKLQIKASLCTHKKNYNYENMSRDEWLQVGWKKHELDIFGNGMDCVWAHWL